MTKISALSDIGTSVASNDTFVLVDVSDPTTPNKKIQQQNLFLIPDGTAATPGLRFLNDTDTGLYRVGANSLAISTNGTGRLFVDSSGSIQIGSSFAGFGNGSGVEIQRSTTATLRLTGNSGVGCEFYNTGSLASIQTRSAIPFTIQTNEQERLRITSDGKVGLGTSTFSYLANKLVIDKGATANDGITIVSSNTSNACIWFADGTVGNEAYRGGLDYQHSSDKLNFYVGGSANVTIDSSGRLGVGTTTPNAKLEIVGGNLRLDNNQGLEWAGSNNYIYGNETTDFIAIATNGSERARIDSSGRLLVGTSSQANTGGTLCVNNGIGIVNNTTARFATVEHGNGANGTYATITISATVQSSVTSVIFETLMTGFSGVYLDNVSGQYSNQAAVTMRNNASAGTSAALAVDGAGTTYTLTITTSVTHPVVKVKITAGGLSGDITLPTITFA